MLGHEIAIYSHIDEQKVVTKAPAKFAITAGSKNSYVFNQKHVHFFDKETGKCIDYIDENGKHPFTELSKLVKDPSDTIKVGAPVQEKEKKEEKAKESFISRLKNKFVKKPKEAKPEPAKEPVKEPTKEPVKEPVKKPSKEPSKK